MTSDRMDALLEEALRTGVIPDGATEAERAEIRSLLEKAATLRRHGSSFDDEASTAMPAARARFQRHMAADRPAPSTATATTSRWWSLVAVRPLRYAVSAGAVAAALLVAAAVVRPFGGTETASALSVDDYVQAPGVVSDAAEGVLTVESSEFGTLQVNISPETAIAGTSGALDVAALKAGDTVLVGGIIRSAGDRRATIAANTVALSPEGLPPREFDRPHELREFREGIEGTVAAFVLSPQSTARVVIATPGGERLLVNTDADSAAALFANANSPVGLSVRVGRMLDARRAFALEAVEDFPPGGGEGHPEPGAEDHHGFAGLEGVIIERVANVFRVASGDGETQVVVRPDTRILLGESGLTREALLGGERLPGHSIRVTGGIERGTGRLIADLIVVGPIPAR